MSWIDYQTPATAEEQSQLQRQNRMRTWLRRMGRVAGRILTRFEISGLENIPTEGPVIFAGNHFSTYDAVLFLTHLPSRTQIVGPGDFKLLWPANVVVENVGVIMAQRGSVDRKGLRAMEQVLKNGGFLALFPEGGTWEKGLDDVKSGAAYLSMTTGAKIVPVSIGGTYQVWKRMFRFRRPRVSMHFGEVLPPIVVSGDRKSRQQELQTASVELMHIIYANLPLADRQRYDEAPQQRYWASIDFLPQTIHPADVPRLEGLTELISKPNLFSPLHRNAGLPLDPFTRRVGRYTPAHFFEQAIRALQAAFEIDFKGYLEYRLGEDKANRIYADLAAFLPIVQQAGREHIAIRFTPHMSLQQETTAALGDD
ncbi:MAG: 1-acyl-sn-glycerol-3-phosphate acyltransferase [Chloroflexi bacterium]|nr:1-acyl-sn-glycerol-3-phosphate acyltransferase [Chloroflexota bacterium]